jgi:hypothetical protein
MSDKDRRKLTGLFRYCQVYHIRPQPDEELVASVVTERLNRRQMRILHTLLEEIQDNARLEFVDVIEPQEACLRYLWYEDVHEQLAVTERTVLLVHLGYGHTLMIPWDHCQQPSSASLVRAPGMIEIDRAVAMYAGRTGAERTVGEDELLLYAQRARRAFEPNQDAVKVLGAELSADVYCDIIREQVQEIAERLARCLQAQAKAKNEVEEILLVGEGTAFAPVVDALRSARVRVPIRTLPQPIYAAARGAASKSFRAKNPELEVR